MYDDSWLLYHACLFAIQRQGFGRRQVYKHILVEPMDDLLKQIG